VHKPDEQRFYAAAGFQEDFCAVKAKLSLDQCEEATWITTKKEQLSPLQRCINVHAKSKVQKPNKILLLCCWRIFAQSKQSYCLTDVKKQNGLQQIKELGSCQHYELLLQKD
jgi:hypothetical protein